MVSFSIIILSYNTSGLLKNCLSSLFKNTSGSDYEAIVVDNGSKDDSVKMIKKEFAKVKVIESKENVGFAKGNNLGSNESHGKFLLFLNSDTEVKSLDLNEAAIMFGDNKKLGVVGGKLVNEDSTPQRSYGSFYTLTKVFLMLFGGDKLELVKYKAGKIIKTQWVSGGFMIVRKELFDRLGGFDEHYFMYIEDVDFCYKVKKVGFEVMHNPNFISIHKGQASSDRKFAIQQIFKGLRYFYKKHKSNPEYFILNCMLISKALFSVVIGFITQNNRLVQTYRKLIYI